MSLIFSFSALLILKGEFGVVEPKNGMLLAVDPNWWNLMVCEGAFLKVGKT